GAEHRHQRAELACRYIPFLAREETPAESFESEPAAPSHGQRGADQRGEHEQARARDQPAEAAVEHGIAGGAAVAVCWQCGVDAAHAASRPENLPPASGPAQTNARIPGDTRAMTVKEWSEL